MRILHVETGRHLYGGALQVRYLIEGLFQLGIENILVCPKASAIGAHFSKTRFAEVLEIPCRGDLDFRLLFGILAAIKGKRPDILHVHSRRGADVWGAAAAYISKTPSIITRRVDNPESRLVSRIKYGAYKKVITISEGIKEVLISQGVKEHHVTCVRSAVDASEYGKECDREWFQAEFGLPGNCLVMGMIAQFIERKGHRYVLDAFEALQGSGPDSYLIFFGQGPLEQAVKDMTERKGLEKRVLFAGYREDLSRVLPCLDLIVHPALMEGLGVSLIQAAASGVPIVASRVGGIPEIVRHEVNGLLVPPADTGRLASAMKRLLEHGNLRKEMGEKGRRMVQDEFSIKAMVTGNLDVYKGVLEPRAAG